MSKNRKGFTLIEILIIVGVIGLILTLVTIALNSKAKESRDLKRLVDINALRDGLQLVKNETGTYVSSYCALDTVSACGKQANSELLRFMPKLAVVNDPSSLVACQNLNDCISNKCNYTITKMDADDYSIIFHLETGVDSYASKGCYQATPTGIRKL